MSLDAGMLAGLVSPTETYAATLLRVVDGDTLHCSVKVGQLSLAGLDLSLTLDDIRVRLAGCNAAEVSTEAGKAARDHLTGLLSPGTPLTLSGVTPYKYGMELVASVATQTSVNLVADLITDQWAASWTGAGKAPVPPWPRTVS